MFDNYSDSPFEHILFFTISTQYGFLFFAGVYVYFPDPLFRLSIGKVPL